MPQNQLDKSIHQDVRGKIIRHEIEGVKFNVLFTKKGFLRSGDYHPVAQYDLILKGRVEVTFRQGKKNVVKIYGPNELIVIPPNIPHLFRFITDTTMIEYWEGPLEVNYYQPYRKLIEEQFEEFEKKNRKISS